MTGRSRVALLCCSLVLAALCARPAAADPADGVVLSNSHQDFQDSSGYRGHKKIQVPQGRLESFKVDRGRAGVSLAVTWVDDEGETKRSAADAEHWQLGRGPVSIDLLHLLVESAPDDQDLFEVDWTVEGVDRLRRAIQWYGDPAWAAKQPRHTPRWRRWDAFKNVTKPSETGRLDDTKMTSMRVNRDGVVVMTYPTSNGGTYERTLEPEEWTIQIGLENHGFGVYLRSLLAKGERLQDVDFLERIGGGRRAAGTPRRAGGRVVPRTAAPKPARKAPVRPTFPKWDDTPYLNENARDVTRDAANDKLDPYVGDPAEVRKLMRTLLRPSKAALLVGEPGTGKTAMVEGLAQLIAAGKVPEPLRGKRIIEISFSELNADTKYTGTLEKKMKKFLAELGAHRDEVIVFIDEAHNLIGLGTTKNSKRDIANMLKGPLARGDMGRVIFATTPDEAEEFDKDKAFRRRLIPQRVRPSTVDEAIRILRGRRARIEQQAGVRLGDDALRAAAELGARVPERFLPDAAVDLIDDAVADARLDGKKRVDRAHVEARFRELTGIEPAAAGGSQRAKRVVTLPARLKRHVVGQDHAADVLGEAARRAAAGVEDEDRPQGTFLFAGPTGVGKTEMARALAIEHYGSKDALLRIDMSEYQGAYSVDDFITNLARMVRRRPHAVVLFDEGEKASGAIHNVMLQILEDGRLTWKGHTISFRESILVMTSNVGAEERSQRPAAFVDTRDPKAITRKALLQSFRPEFVNRWDEIIDFGALSPKDIERIVDLQVDRINQRLARRNVKVSLTAAARKKLAAEGYNPASGARELRRTANRRIRTVVANAILDGKITDGDAITVGVRAGDVEARRKVGQGRTNPRRVAGSRGPRRPRPRR